MVQHKYQYGIGLSTALKEGMFLAAIMSEIKELREPIDLSLMVHNLYESSSIKNKKWINKAVNENLKSLRQTLSPRIKKINDHIGAANKTLKALDFEQSIPQIKVSDVLAVVRQRLQTVFELEDAQNMSNEHFHVLLGQLFQKPASAIEGFIKVIDSERYLDETVKLSEPYREGLRQALNVCSTGYYSTAVFIAGKTIEEVINDYFIELFRMNKIKAFDISREILSKKIRKLFDNKAINEELYHRLSNIRLDRNEFGHPSKKILSKKQAHLRIRLIAEIIPEIEKKIRKLKSKKQ